MTQTTTTGRELNANGNSVQNINLLDMQIGTWEAWLFILVRMWDCVLPRSSVSKLSAHLNTRQDKRTYIDQSQSKCWSPRRFIHKLRCFGWILSLSRQDIHNYLPISSLVWSTPHWNATRTVCLLAHFSCPPQPCLCSYFVFLRGTCLARNPIEHRYGPRGTLKVAGMKDEGIKNIT